MPTCPVFWAAPPEPLRVAPASLTASERSSHGTETTVEEPALASDYHQGYHLPTMPQLQKLVRERCWSLWRSRNALPRSPVPLHLKVCYSGGKEGCAPPGRGHSLVSTACFSWAAKQAASDFHSSTRGTGVGQVAQGAGQGAAGTQAVGWHMEFLLRKENQIPLVLLFIRSKVGLSWMALPDWLVWNKDG